MLACSDISKSGSKLLLTMAPNSQADIYLYQNKQLKQLTKFSGIDVGGKFANNEQNIVFVSNRLGNPNVYKMNSDGTHVVKIVRVYRLVIKECARDDAVVYTTKVCRTQVRVVY